MTTPTEDKKTTKNSRGEAGPLPGMGVADRILERINDTIGVDRVFGEPISHGETLMIPVAKIRAGGGGGGGGGTDSEEATGSGEGGGFGATAKPVGAYVITNETVTWKPAVDITKMFVIGNATAMTYFVFHWLSMRARN